MPNAMNFRNGPRPLASILVLGLLAALPLFQMGCTQKAQDKADSQVPAISAFTGGTLSNGVFTPVTSGTNLTIPMGGTAAFKANFAVTGGSAVVMPGNIQVQTTIPFSIQNLTATTTYTLTVTSNSGAIATKTATVTVLVPPSALQYSAQTATYYKDVQITPNSASISGGGTYSYSVNPDLPAGLSLDTASGAITGTPQALTASATYTVTAKDAVNQSTTSVVTIAVADTPLTFTLNPTAIAPGGTAILGWNANQVAGVFSQVAITASPADASLPATFGLSGTANVSPLATTNYTIRATPASGGSAVTQTIGLTVGNAPVALTAFNASPTQTVFGGSSTLTWSYTGVPLSLSVNGSSVLGQPSLSVVPVRRQTYTLSGSNLLNSTPSTLTKTLAARGLDLVAGSIAGAGASDNANSAKAQFNAPRQIAADAAGNLYIADGLNHTIRMVAAGGGVTTLAGSPGIPGSVDGIGSNALFNNPRGIAVTPDGSTIYVYDVLNKAIRKLVKGAGSWTVSTISGVSPLNVSSNNYGQLALDPTGAFLVVVDYYNYCIRVLRLSDNTWGLYAGASGTYGATDNTTPAAARFDDPEGVAFNKAGTFIYVSEYYSTGAPCRIRMLPWVAPAATGAMTPATSGTVTTLAGSATAKGYLDGPGSTALFQNPASLFVDANDLLWVVDQNNYLIRTVTVNYATPGNSVVATVAGTLPTGTSAAPVTYSGSDNGPALSAKFGATNGILCVGTKVYVSDTGNSTIRVFDGTTVSTPVGTSRQTGTTDATGAAARFNAPQGVATYGGYA